MQNKYTIKRKKGKHLTETERAKIEVYLKEGKTKKYIAESIGVEDKTSESVIKALEGLRRKHRGRFLKMFKSITSDNGSEFSDAQAVEQMGIKYFYAHSYCSYERGSNENNNKLIRRFIEKGVDIGTFSKKRIKEIEKFMNDYPRKMFGGLSSNEVYKSLEKNYEILTFRVAIYKIVKI